MGAALSAWGLTVAAYYSRCWLIAADFSPARTAAGTMGHIAMLVTLVLYPSVSGTSVKLLNCSKVTMASGGAAGLDGGQAVSNFATRGATVTLRVLTNDQFFVCWAGSHNAAGIFAAVVVVLYVSVMPVLTLWWVLQDARLRSDRRRKGDLFGDGAALSTQTHRSAPAYDRPSSVVSVFRGASVSSLEQGEIWASNPLHVAHAMPLVAPPSLPPADTILSPFLDDYEPHGWQTKHLDLFLLLLLSLLRALMYRPTTMGEITTKAAVSCTALFLVCAQVIIVRPFRADQSWKGWVRAMLLLDSAGCVLLNAAVAASDENMGGASLTASINIGSYILFVACSLTLVLLLVGFVMSMFKGEESGKCMLYNLQRSLC
jgi:hypothetical protein